MIRNILAALVLSLACALPAFAATPVDVNHADAAAIATSLDGIGLSKANAIVAWRGEHGLFKNVDDLRQVKGIGDKKLARNRDAIRLTGGTKVAATADAKTGNADKPHRASRSRKQ
ncbi:MAG: helix-hairpin-helix domain-containing protein [Rhodanobacteraceae bacterium]